MDIYTGQVNCEHWPVDRLRGWNAGLTNPGPMCGGEGEVQVTSIETCGQLDGGWLGSRYNVYIDKRKCKMYGCPWGFLFGNKLL